MSLTAHRGVLHGDGLPPWAGPGLAGETRRRATAISDAASLVWRLLGVFGFLLAGCATPPPTRIPPSANPFPPDALITQRGVLTVLGRQFTLNGYLASSTTGGKRLILTENFGSVVADVLRKPDGKIYVMRWSRAMKPKWIRRYLAADLECIFGASPPPDCPVRMLSPSHFLLERQAYKLDLQIVAIQPGPQSPELFDESKAEQP